MAFGAEVLYGGGVLYGQTSVVHEAEASVVAQSTVSGQGGLLVLVSLDVSAAVSVVGSSTLIRRVASASFGEVTVSAAPQRTAAALAGVQSLGQVVSVAAASRLAAAVATIQVEVGVSLGGMLVEAQGAAEVVSEAFGVPNRLRSGQTAVIGQVETTAIGDNGTAEAFVFCAAEIQVQYEIARGASSRVEVEGFVVGSAQLAVGGVSRVDAEAVAEGSAKNDYLARSSVVVEAQASASGNVDYLVAAEATITVTVSASTVPPVPIRALRGTYIAVTTPGAATVSERKPFSWPRRIVA